MAKKEQAVPLVNNTVCSFFVLNYIAAATISPRSVISPGSLNLTLQYPKDPQTAV